MTDATPDPDALLARLRSDESAPRRGRLRVFFGFAPGVGKTYRMLQVARALVEEGTDVVVGAVDTHGRYDTASLLLGLDLLPPRKVDGRSEFDLDAALARRPAVLVLDDLAHENPPGSRHPRRWQDVMELVESGVDVFTALNVEHVESLNDVVAEVTGTRVKETVPDAVIERADAVELVDLSPDELLERVRDGRVYLPGASPESTRRMFSRGKLLALRELALRRIAERVDVDVQAWRAQEGVASTWHTAERVLVCVGPSPSSTRLVRAGRRVAAGLRAPWVAACVEPPTGLRAASAARVEESLTLAEALGAEVARLQGDAPAREILDYARRRNVTRIVIGKPTHPRLRDLVRGSLLDEVVRGSGEIDVLVIAGDEHPPEGRARDPRDDLRGSAAGYAWAVALVALATAASWAGRTVLAPPDLVMTYLLVVVLVSARFERGPATLAAALSVGMYDFFFVRPYFTFAVGDLRNTLTFAVMFAVASFTSGLTLRMRRQQGEARERERRTRALLSVARELSAAVDAPQALGALAAHAAEVFDADVAVWSRGEGGLSAVATAGEPAVDDEAARWCVERERPAGLGTDTLPRSKALCVPMKGRARVLGALSVAPRDGAPLDGARRDLLDAFARLGASAMERATLAEDARRAAERARDEATRSALLSAVSHDLRTPLASITGAATTLRDDGDALTARQRAELLDAVCDEAERMARMVNNLLDMTRIASGAVRVKREWVPLEEMVGSAMNRLERALAGRPVSIELAPNLPLLSVDPVLFEQVLVNLLENAARHTPEGVAVDVSAEATEGGGVALTVADRGPGIAVGDESRVFEKFYRAPGAGPSGAGLGLTICEGIVRAHGGTITAGRRAGGGAVFRVELPPAEGAPSVPEETAA